MTKKLWLTYKSGKPFLYPLEWLEKNGIEESDEDKLKDAFPDGGRWCSMKLVEEFTMEHDAKVKLKLTERDPENGQIRKNFDRFDGCLLEVCVEDWDLPWSPTEAGLKKMRPAIAGIILGIVKMHAYDDAENPDLVDFFQRSSSKPESFSATV